MNSHSITRRKGVPFFALRAKLSARTQTADSLSLKLQIPFLCLSQIRKQLQLAHNARQAIAILCTICTLQIRRLRLQSVALTFALMLVVSPQPSRDFDAAFFLHLPTTHTNALQQDPQVAYFHIR
jgi:hypothetical protein